MNDSRMYGCRVLRLLSLVVSLVLSLVSQPVWAQAPDDEPVITKAIPFLPSNHPAQFERPPAAGGSNSILFLPSVNRLTYDGAVEVEDRLRSAPALKLLIDADPGVDDSVALAWLLTQRKQPLQVLGIVSVAGNTTVANAANNTLLILHKADRPDIPVVLGAEAPLTQARSKTGQLLHGPDGLWFLGMQNPQDASNVLQDAPAFYCATVTANPGLHVLALGPLTNIARAVQQCPEAMRLIGQLTILGGAKFGGNQTPVAEYNFWQDPEAADIVLKAGLPITLVLLDAFTQPAVQQKDLDKLFAKGASVVRFLAPAIQTYADVQFANMGRAGIPDAVAAAVALDATLGARHPALVHIVLEQGLSRGQSIVALTAGERITLLADDAELSALAEQAFTDPDFNLQLELGAILMRAADNAQAVMSTPANLLTKLVFRDLTGE